jgi:hypothetical protein
MRCRAQVRYAKGVKKDRLSIPSDLPQVRSDLVLLYDLPPEECHRIIIELTNLVAVAGYNIAATGNPELAQAVLTEATTILDNFDEDVSEFLRILHWTYPIRGTQT